MIKIILALPSFRGGGAERVMINIANNLDNNKFDVNLLVLTDEGPYRELVSDKVNVVNLSTYRVRKSRKKLINTVNYLEPDVILTTHEHLNLLFLIIKKKLNGNPKIIARLTNAPSQLLSNRQSFKTRLAYHLNKIFFDKADIIVAQCEEMKKDYQKLYKIKEEKITHIYNPLELAKIKESISSQNPYNSKQVNFLSVGRLAHQKGFDILLKSFAKVCTEIPNSYLTILGTGDLEQELKQLAIDLKIQNQVDFAGYVDNPYDYYYYSDLYILSSRFEGFPNSLLEALACDTKVVATRCKSGPKEILNDYYGTLVEVEDEDALTNGILEEINKPHSSYDRARDFDVKKIVKEYEFLIKNLVPE